MDPENLWLEMQEVQKQGVSLTPEKLKISDRASICYLGTGNRMPWRSSGSWLRYLWKELLGVVANLADSAEKYKALLTLGYTHYQPAQLVTIGKRATLWMQDFLSDLEELDFALEHIKFLGCRGTTGTEASFLDLFEGNVKKIDEMNRRIAADFGFTKCFPVCGQTYPRKMDSRISMPEGSKETVEIDL